MKDILFDVQNKVNFGFDKFKLDKEKKYNLQPVEVDYEDFDTEIRRLIHLTKKGRKFEIFHSLFVFGPTGVGKTEMVKNIAESEGCIYHKLEVQKIPIEEFEGFPYLQDKKDKKVVRLADPTILPPDGDDRVWILHLDEFNKADSEKMAAVMNLVLTGEIGGSADFNEETGKSTKYKLPERTIIVGSGNFKTQEHLENLNLVNSMDTATSERFHRVVFLDYNASSWLRSFATKEYKFSFENREMLLASRVPPIILYFIMDKMLEEGNKAPFLIPIVTRPDEGGSERTTSPRSWTIVGDNMILDALEVFEKLENKEEFEKVSQEVFGNKERAFDVYFQTPNNQIDFLSKHSPEFGLKGREIIQEIISRYIHFAENRITPEDILFSYKKNRERIIKDKEKSGIMLYLLVSIANYLASIQEKHLKTEDVKTGVINISTFIEDVNIQVEDIVAFIQIVTKSKNKTAKAFHDSLFAINERYKHAYSGFYYLSENEVKQAEKNEKKTLPEK
jgi:hypothetical protein